MLYLVSLGLFLFFVGGNLPLAIGCWLFFVCVLKPSDWDFS